MFFATDREGLYRFRDGSWTHYPGSEGRMTNSVYAVHVDAWSRIWVGTLGGLCTVQGGSIRKFSGEFVIHRPVYAILEDGRGRLWFGTDNGAVRWDGDALREYTVSEGFAGQECNRAAAVLDSRDRLWVGTDLGVSLYQERFDYDQGEIPSPRVLLEGMRVEEDWYGLERPQRLRYHRNDLMFHFRAISLIDGSRVMYRTRLEGQEEDWQPAVPAFHRMIRYTNLPPGQYRFHAQARNALGIWGRVASSELLTIRKPFWSQVWFIVLMMTACLGVVYGIQSYISERRYAARLEKQVEERTAQLRESLGEKDLLLKEVHHRVKNNFAVVSSLLNLQANSVEDEKTRACLWVAQYRIRSMALVHEQLYRAENLTGIPFADYIRTLTKSLIRSNGVDGEHISFSLDADDVHLGVDRAIPCGLIVNELVTNALKHAFPDKREGSGTITVGMHRREDGFLELTVRDDGVGLPLGMDVHSGRSLGLHLVFLLAEDQLGGSVEVEREEGTCFRIVFDAPEDG